MKPTSRAQKSAFFLFLQQTKLLTVKNVKLQIRNKVALLTQASIGAIFLLLLLFMQYSVNSNSKNTENFIDTKIPTIHEAGNSIPRCFPGASALCFSFVYSPDTPATAAVAAKVSAMGNLPGKDLPFGYRAFASSADQDNFFFQNPNTTSIGVVFNNPQAWNTPGVAFDYSLQLNTTLRCASLGALKCDWPMLDIRAPMQFAIDTALLQLYGGPSDGEIKGGFSNFPHPDLPIRYDVMTGFGPLFLYVAVIFNFVIQLQTIVSEKQAHLKDSMTQMGLLNSSYWCSWFLSNLLVSLFVVIILIIMGAILQLEIFLKNDFGTYFFFFFLCSVAFTSFAFTMSTCTRQADTARSMGLFFFILTFIACPVIVAIYFNSDTETYYKGLRRILQFIPAFGYFQGVSDLIKHSSGETAQGLKWSDISDSNIYWSLSDCYRSFILVAFVFFFLAPYLDLVRGNEYGQKKNCCFCFFPSYWFRMKKEKIAVEKNAYPDEEEEKQLNNDVLKESQNLRTEENLQDRNIALKITGLSKYFVTPAKYCVGKKMKSVPANTFKAVDKLWYGVDEGQLFALLGHNGAGKTTTINMLTGLMNVTQGDASIFGYSVRTEMDNIQQLMGVCPQHDILWDQLTGREHLQLFARLKGIPAERIEEEVRARLDDVKLSEKEADSDAANYSGGMRRRLSIAIALLGDPRIVFLDEPTTGMDPVTRRHVWDMITRAKVGRVVMLTTHSMEEADVLGDRIGIMARGRMVALGTSLHLKATLGAGFRVTLQVPPIREAAILSFIATETNNSAKLVSNVEGHMTFQFPRNDGHDQSEMMSSFFAKLEDQKEALGVLDFSIGMTTLEDVFINTAHKDEEEEKKRQEEKEREAEGVERLEENNKTDVEMHTFQKTQEHKIDDSALLANSNDKKDLPQSDWAIFKRQFSALWKKNWSFQKRQRKQTGCVILTPVFLIVLLLLLQVIIFDPLRDDALQGVDLNCMTNLFKLTFPTASTWLIGVPYKRSGGPPLRDFGSAEYVDEPQYNILVSGGANLGVLNTTPTVATKTWFTELQHNARAVTQCDLDYQTTLDDRDNLDLQTADAWQTTQTTPSYGASQCTVQGGSSSSAGGSYAPSASILARLASVQQVRDACKDRASANLVTQMGGFLLAPELIGTRVASGVMAGISMHGYVDSLWTSVATRIQAVLIQNSAVQLAAAMQTCGISVPASMLTFPILCGQPCLANLTQPILNDALAVMANLSTSSPVVHNATANLCTYMLNLDVIRGLTVVPVVSKAVMDTELYTEYVNHNPTNGEFYFTKFAAFFFQQADDVGGNYQYVAYFNNTGSGGGKPGFETGNWLELVNMMDSAIVARWTNHSITVSTRSFPSIFTVAALDPLGGLSIIDFVASSLLPFLLMLYIYIIVGALVYEKEQKLRMMMKMSGMSMTVYWGVNYVFFLLQYSAMLGVTWILGILVDMQFFKLHDPAIIFCFLFVWGHTLVALSFLFSMFFNSPKTSTGFSFLLILVFAIVGNQLLQQIIQSSDATESSYASLVWMPPMAMLRSMLWLSLSGAFNEKITRDNWWTVGDGSVPLGILWCFGEWIVMMFFVWYLENTLSVGYGVSKHPCFCFQKRYWNEVRGKLEEEQESTAKELKKERNLRPDVAAEQDRVFDIDGQKNPPVVRVLRLEKDFKRGKTSFKAVNGVTFGINSNECFGLLGHNGAGKTTTINILSGLFKPSGGNAFVKQFSIKTDIDTIHTHMGVCNQHDILWGDLSAIEHLMFYGRLKNLQGKELDEAVKAALESVKLTKFGNRQAKAYSGGMKRRLSVACALIGSPLVTYLDEPSTGLDPASRHNLWDVIIASKGKRSLILTTHSMEEADVLCDRIGIMDFGRLQCLGTSPELKQRFGAGYTMMVTSSDRSQGSMKNLLAFLVKNWPSATLLNEPIAGSMKLEIFANEVKLSSCFRTMEANRDELKITDWGITETTLEEVFLKVTSEGFLTRDRAATNSVLMGEQPPPSDGGFSSSNDAEKRITVT